MPTRSLFKKPRQRAVTSFLGNTRASVLAADGRRFPFFEVPGMVRDGKIARMWVEREHSSFRFKWVV
jgi:hypothetical protein